MDLEAKFTELGTAFDAYKKTNDQRLDEIKKLGAATSETEAKLAKINTSIDGLNDELKNVKTAFNRAPNAPAADPAAEQKKVTAEMRKAYDKFLRKGEHALTADEVKTLSVISDPDGGYLVLPEMGAEIVKKVFESSPIRQLASVLTIGSDALELIEDLDEMASGWVGESEARPATATAVLKKLRIPTHELYAMPVATQKIIDDAMFNLEAWISEKVSQKFIRDEATAFVSGTGVGKPRGFASYANGTSFGTIEQIGSGSSGLFTFDGLINLSYAIKAPYRANASWLLQRASVGLIRKLKDSQNRYLWEPGLQVGSPDMLLGHPVFEANDIAAAGAGALAAAFGDFKQGYQIVDRVGIRVIRDIFSSKPNIQFYTTKRVGGDVKNFEAIKLQVLT